MDKEHRAALACTLPAAEAKSLHNGVWDKDDVISVLPTTCTCAGKSVYLKFLALGLRGRDRDRIPREYPKRERDEFVLRGEQATHGRTCRGRAPCSAVRRGGRARRSSQTAEITLFGAGKAVSIDLRPSFVFVRKCMRVRSSALSLAVVVGNSRSPVAWTGTIFRICRPR